MESLLAAIYLVFKDPTRQSLVQFGAGASPLRVALRTGWRLWAWNVGLEVGECVEHFSAFDGFRLGLRFWFVAQAADHLIEERG